MLYQVVGSYRYGIRKMKIFNLNGCAFGIVFALFFCIDVANAGEIGTCTFYVRATDSEKVRYINQRGWYKVRLVWDIHGAADSAVVEVDSYTRSASKDDNLTHPAVTKDNPIVASRDQLDNLQQILFTASDDTSYGGFGGKFQVSRNYAGVDDVEGKLDITYIPNKREPIEASIDDLNCIVNNYKGHNNTQENFINQQVCNPTTRCAVS
jgi:hypothetical protein